MDNIPEKCSRCGAPISWEEGASIVKCDFCGYKNKVKNVSETKGISKFRNLLLLTVPIAFFISFISFNAFIQSRNKNITDDKWLAQAKTMLKCNSRENFLYCRDQYEKAIELLDLSIAAKETSKAWSLRAQFKMLLNKYTEDSELQDINKAIKLDPKNANSYKIRSQIRKISDYEERFKDLNKAIKLDPKISEFYELRCKVYETQANQVVKKAYSDAGFSYMEFYYLPESKKKKFTSLKDKFFRLALRDCDKAIKLDYDNYSAYFNRYSIKKKSGDYQGALIDINKAIRIRPEMGYLWHNRAVLKSRFLNDCQGALMDGKRAYLLDGSYYNWEDDFKCD